METIRIWVMGLITSAVAGAVVMVISPDGATQKAVKTLVSVFLLCSIILPFAGFSAPEIDFSAVDQTDNNGEDVVDAVSSQLEKELSQKIENILLQNGIQPHSVSIDINAKGEELSVDRVVVEIGKSDTDKTDKAKKLIQSQLQISAEVVESGEMENEKDY